MTILNVLKNRMHTCPPSSTCKRALETDTMKKITFHWPYTMPFKKNLSLALYYTFKM